MATLVCQLREIQPTLKESNHRVDRTGAGCRLRH